MIPHHRGVIIFFIHAIIFYWGKFFAIITKPFTNQYLMLLANLIHYIFHIVRLEVRKILYLATYYNVCYNNPSVLIFIMVCKLVRNSPDSILQCQFLKYFLGDVPLDILQLHTLHVQSCLHTIGSLQDTFLQACTV